MVSAFRDTLDFFGRLGIYDVVLPFLLTFTIVYAVLEKTKVYGLEEMSDGKKYTRKNLNSMTAFVLAFFVVASAELVRTINVAMANVVLLMLLGISFLVLAGVFHQETEEGFFLEGGYKTTFMVIMFAGVLLVFLHALGWLEVGWNYVRTHWNSPMVSSLILLVIILGLMAYITGGFNSRRPGSSGSSSE